MLNNKLKHELALKLIAEILENEGVGLSGGAIDPYRANPNAANEFLHLKGYVYSHIRGMWVLNTEAR